MKVRINTLFFVFLSLLISSHAMALTTDVNVFDNVISQYQAAAAGWGAIMVTYASRLFWSLTAISLVWTFGFMSMAKADLAEMFAEFIRFTIFTGFFWWILTNAPNFSNSIVKSMNQLGATATGNSGLNPNGIVQIGFDIFFRALDKSSLMTPVQSVVSLILSGAILIMLALIGINMLLLLCSAWIVSYGGIFFLGFGGSRWTSDIAINYYKTILGIGATLLGMTLLVGIGTSVLNNYYVNFDKGINLKELSILVIVVLTLFFLVNKVPAVISGIVLGATTGSMGISTGGMMAAAAAIGAAAGAAAAAAYSALKDAAAGAAGANSAVEAAMKAADAYEAEHGESLGFGKALGGGIMDVVKEQFKEAKASFDEASSNSFGGKVADAINKSNKSDNSESDTENKLENGSNPKIA